MIKKRVNYGESNGNKHVFVSDAGKAAVWTGVIGGLWKLGRPVGKGGSWKDTQVKEGESPDPYLIACHDKKELWLSYLSAENVTFVMEADPGGSGEWITYAAYAVASGEAVKVQLPAGFQARWVRFEVNKQATATAWLDYK